MLQTILRMYVMAMATGVRSPLPHLVGPPGVGKSTVIEQAAELLGVNLHVINLARVSPLELEGVQMPHGDDDTMKLKLLHATFWTQIKEGDIVLFDEALRAFPEVFNGLLDILTSRKVADLILPRAFFIAASNSVATYDKALEDRLLHITVPDLRRSKTQKRQVAELIVNTLGLMPGMIDSPEMMTLIDTEIAPMYDMLDQFKGKGSQHAVIKGTSVRKLIGQAQLRQIESDELLELLRENNRKAYTAGKYQFIVLPHGNCIKQNLPDFTKHARALVGNSKLTEIQALNLNLNLQLVEMEAAANESTMEESNDDIFAV